MILAQLVYDVFFAKAVVVEETAGTTWLRFKKHVASLGGAGILVANAVRLLACLGLLSLTLPTAFWFHHREGEGTGPISNLDVLHDGLSGVFVRALSHYHVHSVQKIVLFTGVCIDTGLCFRVCKHKMEQDSISTHCGCTPCAMGSVHVP